MFLHENYCLNESKRRVSNSIRRYRFYTLIYLFICYEAQIYANMCIQQAEYMLFKDPIRHEFRPWCVFSKENTVRQDDIKERL